MKKRLISLVLVLLMAVSVIPFGAFAEDSDVGVDVEGQYGLEFSVDSATPGNDDETVTVNVRVANNGGFAGVTYQLLFDKNVLSLEQQPVLGDFSELELVGGPLEEGKHTAMLSATENVYGNGIVATYTFKIKSGAECGTYDIKIITDGYAELSDGNTVKLEVLDEDLDVLESRTVNGSVTIPGYTVTYDVNASDGSGAPEPQTKSKNGFVYISSTLPSRQGYSFEGWATSADAATAEYKAGDKYSKDEDVTLYAVWKKVVAEGGSIDLVVSTVEAKSSDEVEIAISVENHLGFHGLSFDVVYDNEKLDYISYTQNMMFSGMLEASDPDRYENKVNFQILTSSQNVVDTGALVTLKFKVLDEAEDGLAEVAIVPDEIFCLYGEKMEDAIMTANVTNGGVEISNQMLGDIDLDEDVDIHDAILLFRHCTLPETYPIDYKGSVDFDNSGSVDIADAILLFRYSVLPEIYPIG